MTPEQRRRKIAAENKKHLASIKNGGTYSPYKPPVLPAKQEVKNVPSQ